MILMNIECHAFAQLTNKCIYIRSLGKQYNVNEIHLNWFKKLHALISLICHWQGIKITHRVAFCDNCLSINQNWISHLLICLMQFMSVHLWFQLWFLFKKTIIHHFVHNPFEDWNHFRIKAMPAFYACCMCL